MNTKKNTKQKISEIEQLEIELAEMMQKNGIDPTPYSIAIRITAETLFERDKAYQEYIEHGGRQVTDKGRSDPTAVRLVAWNSQARACLSMLKLTPIRPRFEDSDTEQNDSI